MLHLHVVLLKLEKLKRKSYICIPSFYAKPNICEKLHMESNKWFHCVLTPMNKQKLFSIVEINCLHNICGVVDKQ